MNSYLPSVLFEQPLVEMLMETYWIWRRNCFNSKYPKLSIQFESFSLFLLPSILEYYVLYYSGVPTTHKVNREVRLLTTALLWVLILTIACLVTITYFLIQYEEEMLLKIVSLFQSKIKINLELAH